MDDLNIERIDCNSMGNPRYVIHFTTLRFPYVTDAYKKTIKAMKKFGLKKYHNKKYGGGLSFVSYNTKKEINLFNKIIKINEHLRAENSGLENIENFTIVDNEYFGIKYINKDGDIFVSLA